MFSLLDRLDASAGADPRDVYAFRDSVSRDLEALLNTRSEEQRLVCGIL